MFVQLFLHEVGHLLAVRRVGFPFVRLAAGPVTLLPRGKGYRFGANREWLHFVVGAVYYELHDLSSARKSLFVAAAGPIATAFIALISLAAEESFAADRASIGYAVASANVSIAAGLLVVNLLPFRLGRMESDGRQIWLALRSLARRG
jgi:Zn-dependent protease